jgi:hypothetical protein
MTIKKKKKIPMENYMKMERMHLMKAKDTMFQKTGIESTDVDHNIIKLGLNDDEEFNAIAAKS